MTIHESVRKSFAQCKIGEEYDTGTIKSMVNNNYGIKPSCIIPSDYCYNITNEGMHNYVDHLHIFTQIERGRYRYLGENYPFTGKVYKNGLVVGEWLNGKYTSFVKFENSNIKHISHSKRNTDIKRPQTVVYEDPRKEFLRISNVSGNSTDEMIRKSIKRAYGDFCRTLKGFGKIENKSEIKTNSENLLYEALNVFIATNISDFDAWHKELLNKLINKFTFRPFTIGQAQKWINMSFKYLYCFTSDPPLSFAKVKFSQCHSPIDNYVMKNALTWHGIEPLPIVWSKLNDYNLYIRYQKSLKCVADKKRITQLELDFELWQP